MHDNTFTAVHKDQKDNFHKHLNQPIIQYTKDVQEILPFLDCLVTHNSQQTTNNNLQRTDTYQHIARPVILQPDLSQGHNVILRDLTRFKKRKQNLLSYVHILHKTSH